MPIKHSPNIEQLKRALEVARMIEGLEIELASIMGAKSGAAAVSKSLLAASAASPKVSASKRSMSPAARRKIGQAQKMRWKKVKSANGAAKAGFAHNAGSPVAGRKRVVSAESRARMAAAAKKRWAKHK